VDFLLLSDWRFFLLCFCLHFFTFLPNHLRFKRFILFGSIYSLHFHVVEFLVSIWLPKVILSLSFLLVDFLVRIYCLFCEFLTHSLLLFSFNSSIIEKLSSFPLGFFILLFIALQKFHTIVIKSLVSRVLFRKIFAYKIIFLKVTFKILIFFGPLFLLLLCSTFLRSIIELLSLCVTQWRQNWGSSINARFFSLFKYPFLPVLF